MAGLDATGFTPLTEQEILEQVEARFRLVEPNYDLSEDSLDGQAVRTMAYMASLLWDAIGATYDTFDPNAAKGQALKNLGLLTGISKDRAQRGTAYVEFAGTAATVIPKGTLVADGDGVEYKTVTATTVAATGTAPIVEVVCNVTGKYTITAGTITTIVNPIVGITGVTQPYDGVAGSATMSDTAYRNLRTSTVLRNHTDTAEVLSARLYELGIEQVYILNNSDPTNTVEGIPPRTLGVFLNIGSAVVTDEEIAQVIQDVKGLGCPTAGSTSVTVKDSQNYDQVINFTKTAAVDIEVAMNITFLDIDHAGAENEIRRSITEYINALPAGQDVIWSHLFALITPYGSAQVNTMQVGLKGGVLGTLNVPVAAAEHAAITTSDISITVV